MALCDECHNELIFKDNSCKRCALPLSIDSHQWLCGHCQLYPPCFDAAISLFDYHRPVDHLIHQLKFNRRLAVARLFGQLLAEYLQNHANDLAQCIIPIPLSRQRLRERGFNQSIELARPVRRILGLPIERYLLKRTEHRTAQMHLDLDQRQDNIAGVFKVSGEPRYKHVALLDDVVTTMATVNEASRVLKQAGVERVDVWSIARAVKQ